MASTAAGVVGAELLAVAKVMLVVPWRQRSLPCGSLSWWITAGAEWAQAGALARSAADCVAQRAADSARGDTHSTGVVRRAECARSLPMGRWWQQLGLLLLPRLQSVQRPGLEAWSACSERKANAK